MSETDWKPTTATELASLVLENFENERRPLIPCGGRTSLHFGYPVAGEPILVSTTALESVIDYPCRDMTITVEAGMTIADLANTLAEHRQFLPFDVPHAEIATIGGFDLVFSGQSFGNDEFQYDVILARTGVETDIDLALTVTPLGAVSRIEHMLSGFEDERSQYRFRLDDAKRRLGSYQSRQGGEFGFEDELADKRRQLDAIEADLADEVLKEGKKAMEAA